MTMVRPIFSFSRAQIAVAVMVVVAVLGFFPLRVAFDVAGIASKGVSARQIRGPLWYGRADGLMIGAIGLGDADVALSPLRLLKGQIGLNVARRGDAQSLSGTWISSLNQRGVEGLSGTVSMGGGLGILPINALEFDGLSVSFAGDSCLGASGRLRLRMDSRFAGLSLSQGLSGAAACDGRYIVFPLLSQSGMERLTLRIARNGHYRAKMVVKGGKGMDANALMAAGLVPEGSDYALTAEGQL